ncbi:hypothetical protein BN440_1713 [Erwinia amylovora MR1]|nr:hypothetical protein BN440_1713 [Erwinia amylovora MR1]
MPNPILPYQRQALIAAFQMHFRPSDYRGIADAETEAIAAALLEKIPCTVAISLLLKRPPMPARQTTRHRRCGNRGYRRRAAGKIPCTVAISLLLKTPAMR